MRKRAEKYRQLGAATLELAIVLPLTLGFIFTFVEFARWTTYNNLLESGAQKALTYASIVPGLADETQRDDLKLAIENKAREIPNLMLDNSGSTASMAFIEKVEAEIPKGSTELQNNPITITVEGTMRPIIPLMNFFVKNTGGFPIKATAVGFREPSGMFSMPVLVDCVGNPIGSPEYFSDCPCPSGQVWNSYSRECVCIGQRGFTAKNENGSCDCLNDAEEVSGSFTVTNSLGIVSTQNANGEYDGCYCPYASNAPDSIRKQCDTSSGKIAIIPSCQCVCPSGKVEDGSGKCGCEEGKSDNGSGGCVCTSPQPASCGPNESWNSQTCQCVACSSDKENNGSGTACVCKAVALGENQCPPDRYWSNSQCQCLCPKGSVEDGAGGACGCADSNFTFVPGYTSDTSCKCQKDCDYKQLNSATCTCSCPNGTSDTGTACEVRCQLGCTLDLELGTCVCGE